MCAWLALVSASALAAAEVPAYTIQTVAGSGQMGDSGPALLAQFGVIRGLAVDNDGNLYVSDTDNNRVRKVDPSGIVSTYAGNGTAGFSGDGGQATAAQLDQPYGLAADSAGNLYIADFGNNRVRMVSAAGTISTFAGNGAEGYSGDNVHPTQAQLYGPRNVVLDAAGNLFISEFAGQRVRMVTSATAVFPTIPNTIYTFAGTGIAGYSGDTGPSTAAQLNFPAGLAVDSTGAVYIADSGNSRVRKVIPHTPPSAGWFWTISTVANGIAQPNLVVSVTAVAVNAVNQSPAIYVASPFGDAGFFTAAGNSYLFSAGGGSLLSGSGGLAIDSAGDVYIANGMRIWKVKAADILSAAAGTGGLYPPATLFAGDGYMKAIGDGTAATSAILHQPSAVAFDTMGNLFIADSGSQRVRKVTSVTATPPSIISTVAGTGTAGYNGDGIAATAAWLNSPTGLAMDPSNNLFVADSIESLVREIASTVAPSSRISTFVGMSAAGLGQDGSTPAKTPLDLPHGVCTGSDGSVYIVDTMNYRVLVVPPSCVVPAGTAVPASCLVTTFAGNGGQGNAGDGYYARYAQLNRPTACALDGSGNLYIADTGNHAVRMVNPALVISTVAGTGALGFSGDGGAATAAALDMPSGVAADNYGNIFIADTGNHAIRMVTVDGLIHTIAGQATPGFSGDSGAAVNALLNSPSGMVLDGAGDLYFADTGNNRVRRLTPGYAVTVGTDPLNGALALVNAASLAQGSVAPGEIVTIYGLGIGPSSGVSGSANPSGAIGTLLAGAQASFDSVAAPLFYAQATQINAQAPYSISGENFTQLVVSYQGRTVGTLTLAVAPSVPGLFAAALNQDGSLNSSSAPAARGTVVTFFGTGEGLTEGANVAGQPAPGAPYLFPTLPVTLTVNGIAAQLLYAGEAPGFSGLLQVDAFMPGGFIPSGAVSVQLMVGVAASPAITVWLE